MSLIFPYRIAEEMQAPKPPSNRDEFVRATLEKKFSVNDARRWFTEQAAAKQPDVDTWRKVMRTVSKIRLPDMTAWILLLNEFGERVHFAGIRAHESATHRLASLLDQQAVELYVRDKGYYLVASEPVELLKFHADKGTDGPCRFCGVSFNDAEEKIVLLQSTLFRAWQFGDDAERQRARALVCGPYLAAVADEAHEAEDAYGRATIVGWGVVRYKSHSSTESDIALRIPRVVVWDHATVNSFMAWLYDGSLFSPDSFVASAPDRYICPSKVDDVLYGYSGRLFKTRNLLEKLRELHETGNSLCIVSSRMSRMGEPPQLDEDILFVQRSSLRSGRWPEGGKRLL